MENNELIAILKKCKGRKAKIEYRKGNFYNNISASSIGIMGIIK